MWPKLVIIGIGGGLGSIVRYLLSGWAQRFSNTFPAGTLAVNLLGCFLIGFLGILLIGTTLVRDEYRLALIVGLLGGFTTFSAFGWETMALVTDGELFYAALNIAASVGCGLGCVWLGMLVGRTLIGGV
jgi:CrcB protein